MKELDEILKLVDTLTSRQLLYLNGKIVEKIYVKGVKDYITGNDKNNPVNKLLESLSVTPASQDKE